MIRRRLYRQWIFWSQALVVGGLGLAAIWNVASLVFGLPDPLWYYQALLPLPGLLSWVIALACPLVLPHLAAPRKLVSYRLTYDVPGDWGDERLRAAILHLLKLGVRLDLIWARDGQRHEAGCWALLSPGDDEVFSRIVTNLAPGGAIEEDAYPAPTGGVVVLRWREMPPSPPELVTEPGLDGVYYRRTNDTTATVALWGPNAAAVAGRYAHRRDILPEPTGVRLFRPLFSGDNPWPEFPPFPTSAGNPGLSSVSRLERVAPELRLNGQGQGVVFGRDREQQAIGFALPNLAELDGQPLRLYGHLATPLITEIAAQLIAKHPGLLILLDGQGKVVAGLSRSLLRQMADERLLICDTERPAQSRFRLNPLWLPGDRAESWAGIYQGWEIWLQELGLTPGGIGAPAYRHIRVAMMMVTALATYRRLVLDPTGLEEALESPDFLTSVGHHSELAARWPELMGPELWPWWLAEGQHTSNFDVRLRLAHLRDRLNALLEVAEYRVLWRPPYLDPTGLIGQKKSLLWRVPDPRRRLRSYLTSQLLAVHSLLTLWPAGSPPVMIILHEVPDIESWARLLGAFPSARLILSFEQVNKLPTGGALLLSRLTRSDAERLSGKLPGDISAADLRRLPENRLVLRHRQSLTTLEVRSME